MSLVTVRDTENRMETERKFKFSSLSALLLANVVCTYLLVVLGSTVRVSNSGTGCPSWPLCYGQATPIYGNTHALVEQSHRYLASIVSVLVFAALVVVLLLKDKKRKHFLIKLAWLAAGTIVIQVILGAITVVTNNAPWTVAAHLAMAMIFTAVMVVYFIASLSASYPEIKINIDTKTNGRRSLLKKVKALAYLSVVFTFLIIISGSLIVDGGAEQHCASWPLCPSGEPGKDVLLNLIHRSIVGLTFVIYILFAIMGTKLFVKLKWWRNGVVAVISVIVITAAFGALSALTKANPVFQDFHLALATLVWIAVVSLVTFMHFEPGQDIDLQKKMQ